MKPEGICPASKKIGWPNQAGAEIMLQHFNTQNGDDRLRSVYECPDCGHWHLTSCPQATWVIEHRPSRLSRFLNRFRASFEVWPA